MAETESKKPIEGNRSVLGDVARLASLITNAQTADEVGELQAQLMALLPLAHGDSVALGIIMGAIGSAQARIGEIAQTARDARIMAGMNTDTRTVYKALDENGLLTEDDKQYLAKLDPKKEYEIPEINANGNATGKTRIVTGAQVKESLIISKGWEHRDSLPKEAQQALDRQIKSRISNKLPTPEAVADDASRMVQSHKFAYNRTRFGGEKVAVQFTNGYLLGDQVATNKPLSPEELALQSHIESMRIVKESPKAGNRETEASFPPTTVKQPEKEALARQEQTMASLASEMKSTSLLVRDASSGVSPQELALQRVLAVSVGTIGTPPSVLPPPTPSVRRSAVAVTPPAKPSAPPVATAQPAIAEADAFAGVIDNPAAQTQSPTPVLTEGVKAAVATMVAQKQQQQSVLPPLPTPPKPATPGIRRLEKIPTNADGSLSISKVGSPVTGPTLNR